MGKLLRMSSVVGSLILLAGCGSLILNSNFQGASGSPAGAPPGPPSDDQIVVQDPANPVISASELRFKPPQDKAFFFSHPVQQAESTKTIFWKGHLKSGDGPFTFLISGHNTPASIFLTNPLEVSFSNNEVKLIGPPPNNAVLHTHALSQNTEHQVFISLRLKSGTYRMTIQQPTAPEIEFTGQLSPLTGDWIKSHSRIVLQAGFLSGATSTDEYVMDDVIMREKQD